MKPLYERQDDVWFLSELAADYILQVCCSEYAEAYFEICLNNEYELAGCKPEYHNLSGEIMTEFSYLLQLENLTYREQLRGSIYDFLIEQDSFIINPWGYFEFRLLRYKRLLERSVRNVLNRLLEGAEYRNLMTIAESFLALRGDRSEVLHIVFDEGGGVKFFDAAHMPLFDRGIGEEVQIVARFGFKYDEALAAAIMKFAPQRAVIHNYALEAVQRIQKGPLSPIVTALVSGGLTYCEGCLLCAADLSNRARAVTHQRTACKVGE